LQTRWHRFWAVCSFRCEGDSPETLEKSPEYPGFTDKFVLSGDFQDSPIHPPSRRHQDPFTRDGACGEARQRRTCLGLHRAGTATASASFSPDAASRSSSSSCSTPSAGELLPALRLLALLRVSHICGGRLRRRSSEASRPATTSAFGSRRCQQRIKDGRA
jgi:hypothetical protein